MISTMIEIIEVENHFVVVSITSVKWAIPFNICTPPIEDMYLSRFAPEEFQPDNMLTLRNCGPIVCPP